MADDNLFTINLVTPERILLTGLATEVILRTGEGDATFLAGYAPLVGSVEPGVVRVVRPDGDEERVATHGGFVQVEQHVPADGADGPDGPEAAEVGTSGTRVTMLVGVAELAAEIDAERARAALTAAEAQVAELTGSGGRGTATAEDAEPDAELADAEAALLRAQVRLEAVDATSGATA
ncbi:MAG TPA: hypothetical protein VIC86_01405 [Acidimicrobiales bacterium]|jgi:F-type H+-transporting ATPase subunit epsilon